jgi:hypothetical protein
MLCFTAWIANASSPAAFFKSLPLFPKKELLILDISAVSSAEVTFAKYTASYVNDVSSKFNHEYCSFHFLK